MYSVGKDRFFTGQSRRIIRTLVALSLVLFLNQASSSALYPRGEQSSNNLVEQYLLRLKEAEHYSSQPPPGSGFSGGQKGLLEKIMPDIIRDLGLNWEPDPRLASFCLWLNDLIDVNFMPEGLAINEAASWLGLPEPYPHFIVFRSQVGPRLSPTIKGRLLQIKDAGSYTHYGALAEQTTSNQINIIIVFSPRHLFLLPFPRNLDEPGEVELKFGLYPGYRDAVIILTPPEGQPEIQRVEGDKLSLHPAGIKVRFKTTGTHRLEIVARNQKGPQVLANFPVYVGLKEKILSGGAIDAISAREQSASRVREKLYLLVNQERERAGLNRLEKDPRLEEIAGNHCRDMVKNNFTGHVSPTTGGPDRRLKEAGIEFDHLAENVAKAYNSAEEIHRGFMESPGHRMAILDPKVTHFGIWVEAKGSGPGKAFLITELFIRKAGPASAPDEGQILQKIIEQQTPTGAERLSESDRLSWLARRAAEEFSQRENFEPQELQLFLMKEITTNKMNFEKLNGLIIIASKEEDIVEKINQTGLDRGRVGIGIKRIPAGPRSGKFLVIVVYQPEP